MKNSLFNTVVILTGVCLIALLSYTACNTSTKEVETHAGSTLESNHSTESSSNNQSSSTEVDAEIDLALSNFEKGMAEGNMDLAMGGGIQKLLGVVRQDSNNVRAIYHLGLFSIQSGQFEKAEKRFEKLILLQPENQEYQKTLAEIREKLEKK